MAMALPVAASAFGLRTHLWISQQVIDDVVDDCNVEILVSSGERIKLPVDSDVCDALRQHPKAYRAGHLGPDAFPDPVVGQMTTHPGIENGWQTDRWLKHMLDGAKSSSELALAYGFVGHAAGDMFAHTYVNHYAGDIFVLSDGETLVELRHFALEKFIESKTPPLVHQGTTVPYSRDGVEVPARYIASRLIYNEGVAREYFKVRFGIHLASLHLARGAVIETGKASQTVVDAIAKAVSEYYKLQVDQIAGVNQAQLSLDIASASLKGAEEALKIQERLLQEAKNGLDDVHARIKANEDFILSYPGLLSVQLNIIAQTTAEISKFQGLIADIEGQVVKIQAEIAKIMAENSCKVVKQICSWVEDTGYGCVIYPPSCVAQWVCRETSASDARCDEFGAQVASLTQQIGTLRSRMEAEALKQAKAIAEKLSLEARRAEAEVLRGTLEAARFALESQIAALQTTTAAARELVDGARVLVAEAQSVLDRAKDALDLTKQLIGKIEDLAKQYNTVTLFFKNWVDGIDRAGDDYVEASLDSSLAIINLTDGAMEPYKRWLQCSLLNYAGVPWQLPYAYCEVKDKIDEVRAEIDRIKESLPPVLQWLLDPMGEVQEELVKRVRPELWKAAETAVDFVLKPPAGRFINMLANPAMVGEDKLREVYTRTDAGGKAIIPLPDVAAMIKADIGIIPNDLFSPGRFRALSNAVTLAKLSILSPRALNLLFSSLAGAAGTRYGPTLYDENFAGRFSLLLDSVRSIDGNHQWQPFGLPYPRLGGAPEPGDPKARHYGHSVHDHPQLGFRFFADPIAREMVFHKIFDGPVEGTLAMSEHMKFPPYTHPACASNPFPRTVDDNGWIEGVDLGCVSNANPVKWLDSLGKFIERIWYQITGAGRAPAMVR